MPGQKIESMSNVDGLITPTSEASIPVLDRGFLYGDSIYEVFRTYQGVPLFIDEHFERLKRSADLIHMNLSQEISFLKEEIRRTDKTTGASHGDDLYVRLAITRGEGAVELSPSRDLVTRYVIVVKRVPEWPEKFYKVGMRMGIPPTRRNPVGSLDPNIKGGNYLNNILGITEAREMGCDDCIMLSERGTVTEASNSNVWFVIGGRLVTPRDQNLKGITKEQVHTVCGGLGLSSHEEEVSASALTAAVEGFVTSATREVMPIKSILLESGDEVKFSDGGGEVTRRVASGYLNHIETLVSRHRSTRFI